MRKYLALGHGASNIFPSGPPTQSVRHYFLELAAQPRRGQFVNCMYRFNRLVGKVL